MLKTIELSKNYGKKLALDKFTYNFENGIYGLVGPNGSGKSTLMNMISDVLVPTSGNILYEDIDINKLGKKYREKLGYLPQNAGVYTELTAYENLEFFANLRGVSKKLMKEYIEEALENVNLLDERDKKAGGFSGGMKRRLAIAITVVAKPEILIFDEPTVGLDPKERVRFRELLLKLKKDKTILLSSHIVTDINNVADRVIMLKMGKMVLDSKVKDTDIENKYMEFFND